MNKRVTRSIVEIKEELCDGCGQCISYCAEGALQIVNGKARLVNDAYCDGLGACIGHCPKDAITIVEREADPFDQEAVHAHSKEETPATIPERLEDLPATRRFQESALRHWPVQLRLVSVKAPFFDQADLLVVADCVPFAYADLHSDLLAGRSVVVGCPKFNDAKGYAEKLGEILQQNDVRSVTLVNMEVPCCFGLGWVVDTAIKGSGKTLPVQRYVVTVKGELREVKK